MDGYRPASVIRRFSSKTTYAQTQQLGSDMRAAGVELFRFTSARDPKGGANVALFTPRAFALTRPLAPAATWTCTVTTRRDVSWMREVAGGGYEHRSRSSETKPATSA